MTQQQAFQNRIIRALPPQDFAALVGHLRSIDLPRGFSLLERDATIERVYFFESGIGSIVVSSPEGQDCEAGLFGREGFGPVQVMFSVDRAQSRTFVQVAGHGYEIEVLVLKQLIDTRPGLRDLLARFIQTLNTQTSFTALSNAVHQIDERLARWILMCHDRHDGDEVNLTHEFLSLMLAVRRPSVTSALHVLEGNGFIRAERGVITVRDRKALEDFARDCYGRPEAEYNRLIGPL